MEEVREIGTAEPEPPLSVPTVVSLHLALLTMATVKEEAGTTVRALPASFGMSCWQGLCELGKALSPGTETWFLREPPAFPRIVV